MCPYEFEFFCEKTAKTSLSWLAGRSCFKLEVAGFSWSPSLARLVKLVIAGCSSWSPSLTS